MRIFLVMKEDDWGEKTRVRTIHAETWTDALKQANELNFRIGEFRSPYTVEEL